MPTDPRVVAIIPARWASTRFPGKPLAPIGGKPMVQLVFEQAQKASLVAETLVATDDERIFNAVKAFGGRAVMSSREHPSGTDRLAEVVAKLECDLVVNVQGDEPMMPPENIDRVVQPFLGDPNLQVATLMTRLHDLKALMNPDICKVVVDKNGFALYFSRAPIPANRDGWDEKLNVEDEKVSGYELSGVFQHLGLYAYTREFLLQFPGLPKSPLEQTEKLEQLRILENGIPVKVIETEKLSVGVDRPDDVEEVKRLMGIKVT